MRRRTSSRVRSRQLVDLGDAESPVEKFKPNPSDDFTVWSKDRRDTLESQRAALQTKQAPNRQPEQLLGPLERRQSEESLEGWLTFEGNKGAY